MSNEAPPIPEYRTPRLCLLPLTLDDAAGLHRAYGDAAAMRFWDAPPSPDLAETARRIGQSLGASPVWHACWAVMQDGRFLGMVNYHARQPWNRRLAVGWILVPEAQGHGYMQEAMAALIDHCFEVLEAHRIEAEIEPENARSLALARRLGFSREGLLRDRLQVGGTPRSIEMWALLRPDRVAALP
ncbi:N-acetyltransferase [Rhodovarius crocodyli]|uniref:N-acetyltransferase n=1 Tax=Rhodovarius crocodyli TaxID=1979269 RepID=A0A437MMN8_9PROT|nr:GNAT family N-acetyltransferase [Rhodovarius crocodyli]RVT98886.1 N-acetyltransferase [Rhodovarius crocodyli]